MVGSEFVLLYVAIVLPFVGALGVAGKQPVVSKAYAAHFGVAVSGGVFGILALAGWYLTFSLPGERIVHDPPLFTWFESVRFSAEMSLRFDPVAGLTSLALASAAVVSCFAARTLPGDQGRRLTLFVLAETSAVLLLILAADVMVAYVGWVAAGVFALLWIGSEGGSGTRALAWLGLSDVMLLVAAFLLSSALASEAHQSLLWSRFDSGFAPAQPGVTGAAFAIAAAAAIRASLVWLAPNKPLPIAGTVFLMIAVAGVGTLLPLARFSAVLAHVDAAAVWLAWFGALLALYSALVGAVVREIDRVFVTATRTHLGWMLVGVASGAVAAALHHVAGFSVFFLLLFLSARAISIATKGSTSFEAVGGLRRGLPRVHRYCVVGFLAAAGFPFLIGFSSRGSLLAAAYSERSALYYVSLLSVAGLSFGLMRAYLRTFAGPGPAKPLREDVRQLEHVVLAGLAVFCVVGGWFGAPSTLTAHSASSQWLAVSTTAVAASGALVAYLFERRPNRRLPEPVQRFRRLVEAHFQIDRLAKDGVLRPLRLVARGFVLRALDRAVLEETFMRGSARAFEGISEEFLKRLHSGQFQTYLTFSILGTLAIAMYVMGAS